VIIPAVIALVVPWALVARLASAVRLHKIHAAEARSQLDALRVATADRVVAADRAVAAAFPIEVSR
jgi:hypothetical protein